MLPQIHFTAPQCAVYLHVVYMQFHLYCSLKTKSLIEVDKILAKLSSTHANIMATQHRKKNAEASLLHVLNQTQV